MSRDQGIEFQKISATTTSGATPATFEGGIQQVYVTADAEITLSIDTPAVDRAEGIVINANLQPVRLSFGSANPQRIYAVAHTGTANVYLMGVRDRG